ncbi:MAG: SUMF1/EgtB/PvdO family nonheme iron enzyme [Gemmatimonadetes bacterium]|nr:SUMF1/EgtB/PvdO family nonheme iron enzyme [Gemmatimonadota bacterium]
MIHKKLGMFLLLVTVGLLAGCKPNQPPNVQAGPDQTVDAGDKVTLRGSASDSDGTIETYRWEQVDGPSVLLSNANQASTSFVALQVVKGSVVLTFRLTVTDDNDATATDDVVVTIAKYGQLGITLSGTVKNHSTYRGISGGTITVRQYQGNLSQTVGAAKTNRNGKYTVQVRVNPGRLTVTAIAAGFAPQSIIVDVSDGSRRTADLALVPVQVTQPFQPENNAAIQVDGQTVVSLSANVLVTESGGAASGLATARVTVLDVSKDPSVMPGDLEQWNADTGEAEPIESFGAINVEFTGANGNRLNLASGKQARISIPLASGRRPEDSPKTIPLYYWSDATGYWVEEGTAMLERTADGKWAYTGSVGHFSTWNADVLYKSITMRGCVQDQQGKPVKYAEVTAHGKDYVGSSKATTNVDGQFEIEVRPDSELELSAAVDGSVYSDAQMMRTERDDMSLDRCLVVTGDQGLRDFPMKIRGTTGSLEICVRDHECEDGDEISVDVEGRTIFSGEIVNEWDCQTIEVRGRESYVVELTALNGTGYKGDCSYIDENTGEIRVTGENIETQVWRHRGGAGSKARIIVETVKQRFPMPEMVVIPAGSFLMGSPDPAGVGFSNARPLHSVRIASFEMSKYEITFEEYDAFTDATGRERAYDPGWGRGRRPVINVSWEDAVAYTQWLSSQTGENYRLPSEAEWEYAARAGSTTRYSWGNDIGVNRANCEDCGSQWDGKQTAPVGSFRANRWGLHDMHGNVWEWVQDCWHWDYKGAPADGSAWFESEAGDCGTRRGLFGIVEAKTGRVLRGGSWDIGSKYFLWSEYRENSDSTVIGGRNGIGFRVVRSF